MRRRTMLVLVAGGAGAAVAAGTLARSRIRRRGTEAPLPDADAIFTVFAPGGQYDFWCNGPIGWLMAKLMPIVETGVYGTVAEMLDMQPDDELLDIGCGPGAFLAAKAQGVRRVVGIDVSPVWLRAAERRLADRITAGTARLVVASAAELPFGDGEFSAVTAINAPAKLAEAYRVLRPGGRLVIGDPDPRKSRDEPAGSWGVPRWGEADYRRMFEDAGFTDVATRYGRSPHLGGELFVSGRKAPASVADSAADIGGERESAVSAASV